MSQLVPFFVQSGRGRSHECLHTLGIPVENREHVISAVGMLNALGAFLSTVSANHAVSAARLDVLHHRGPEVAPAAVEAAADLVRCRPEGVVAKRRTARVHDVDREPMGLHERSNVTLDLRKVRHKVANLLHVLDNLRKRVARVHPHNLHLVEMVLEEHEDGKTVLSTGVEKQHVPVVFEDVLDH